MNSMGDSNFLDVDDFILDSPRVPCSPIGGAENDVASYVASLRQGQEQFYPNLAAFEGIFQADQQQVSRSDPEFGFSASGGIVQRQEQEQEQVVFRDVSEFDFAISDVMLLPRQEQDQLRGVGAQIDFAIQEQEQVCSFGLDIDSASSGGIVKQEQELVDEECSRKRGRVGSCSRPGTKACRERLRREKLNDRFMDLSSVLEPGRPPKTDKPTILDDAIRVLNQLRSEAQELKETNQKLLEEIKCLKAEKHELREEKHVLKADKEKMEEKLKAMTVPSSPGFMAAAAFHPNKMAVFPSYGYVPMWQYLPPSTRDTSRDHELRPPAA
ncbi:PREDICTED: transcription factor bHLH104 [Tarenaya hassleriana]|uniref:transcription factor bHLH104 n=1 Tax=Tarenaya hassleriana TaxID=28532 RepID=UPI00053CA53D|nr:PREDICTED: transcription factor bHLH104 [Tarenaya hassleriana]